MVRARSSATTSTSRSRTTASTSRTSAAEAAIDIAKQLGLPLVATGDAHYLCAGRRRRPRRAASASTRGKTHDPTRSRIRDGGCRTSSTSARPEEMYRLFPEPRRRGRAQPGDRRRRRHRARLQEAALPRLHAARRRRRRTTTCASCASRACSERYGDEPAARPRCDRLEHELGIICRMGFASYFLIVWDFVRFARENGIPGTRPRLGVRRDRQLRAEAEPRRSARIRPAVRAVPRPEPRPRRPISTSTSARTAASEVIDYVKQKYGEESVAQIGTFGTLAAKAAIKDVGRVLDVPLDRVNQLTKHGARSRWTSRSTRRCEQSRRTCKREYETDPDDPRADRHRPASWKGPTATPARTRPASSSPTGRSPTTCRCSASSARATTAASSGEPSSPRSG